MNKTHTEIIKEMIQNHIILSNNGLLEADEYITHRYVADYNIKSGNNIE